jgi:hypothetical protein
LVHAVKTADRLGLEVIWGTGPGWAGSGGSWVKPEDSMQHLVWSSVTVAGPGPFDQVLPVPSAHAPNRFAGMNTIHLAQRDGWYRAVAVLAFPAPVGEVAKVNEADLKTGAVRECLFAGWGEVVSVRRKAAFRIVRTHRPRGSP